MMVNPAANACKVPSDDEIIIIAGNTVYTDGENRGRKFMCTVISSITRERCTKWIRDDTNNIYHLLILDQYCRTVGFARPSAISWITSTLVDSKEDTIKSRIGLDDIKNFFQTWSLNVSEGMESIFYNPNTWKEMLRLLAKHIGINHIVLHPRIVAVLRVLLYRKIYGIL